MNNDRLTVLTIPRVPPSLNSFFGRMHWAKRKRIVDEWHKAVWAIYGQLPPFEKYPLNICCQLHFKLKRHRDTDNTIVGIKLVMDALVKMEKISGDDPRYIGKITLLPPISGTKKEETVITITVEPLIALYGARQEG